ncbi:MAG: FKBP-type peptidyl-prolyl cis-trans isomerase [Bacteroidales bacterium]|nr:FKBP-type peptidyl-prolyl cis-trans isomerase [Bacteroidales bacterium]
MNISRNRIQVYAILAAMAVTASCAKEGTSETNADNKAFFDAWMSVNHPSATSTGLGVYIIDDQPGTGQALTDDNLYILCEYTSRDLDGNINGTTDEMVARQVGAFSSSTYYGPVWIFNLKSYTQAGVIDMIRGMRVGGTRTAVIPGWLNVTKDYDTAEDYLKKCTGDNIIYTIHITDIADDINVWQVDALEKYVAKNMDGVDSTMFGYYYKQVKEPSDTASFPDDTTFYINYTGRLLNGKVFDTNVEDTAKVHGLYSPGTEYAPRYITKKENFKETTMAASSSSSGSTLVDGFSYCLSGLKAHEKGICAFYSSLGYGYSGNGNAIPSFAPIVFEIEVVDYTE